MTFIWLIVQRCCLPMYWRRCHHGRCCRCGDGWSSQFAVPLATAVGWPAAAPGQQRQATASGSSPAACRRRRCRGDAGQPIGRGASCCRVVAGCTGQFIDDGADVRLCIRSATGRPTADGHLRRHRAWRTGDATLPLSASAVRLCAMECRPRW